MRIAVAWVLVLVTTGCGAKPGAPAPAAPPAPAAEPGGKEDPPLPAGVTWPVADGWRREVIPFPLEFAPGVASHGVEEIRFAPDFFKPEAPTFWSYAFVWLLDDAPAVDGSWLEHALVVYFAGLADAVGGEKYHFDPAHYSAKLAPVTVPAGGGAWQGTFEGYEPFKTGQPLTLHIEAQVRDCGTRRAVLLAASPQPPDHEVWARLRERLAAFKCE